MFRIRDFTDLFRQTSFKKSFGRDDSGLEQACGLARLLVSFPDMFSVGVFLGMMQIVVKNLNFCPEPTDGRTDSKWLPEFHSCNLKTTYRLP